eukprot:4912040-Pleurochrysis_carterae.AAC.5
MRIIQHTKVAKQCVASWDAGQPVKQQDKETMHATWGFVIIAMRAATREARGRHARMCRCGYISWVLRQTYR